MAEEQPFSFCLAQTNWCMPLVLHGWVLGFQTVRTCVCTKPAFSTPEKPFLAPRGVQIASRYLRIWPTMTRPCNGHFCRDAEGPVCKLQLLLPAAWVAAGVSSRMGDSGMLIERSLKPKFQLGLTKGQVAKTTALGCSIEQNSEPTVQWLFELGLTKSQVTKIVAVHPRVLGYSIEQNLEPTVQWLLGLGLTKSQLSKAVARFPSLLGCSIERNLERKVQFLRTVLTERECVDLIARYPPVLGYRYERVRERVSFLEKFHDTNKIAWVMCLTEDRYQRWCEKQLELD